MQKKSKKKRIEIIQYILLIIIGIVFLLPMIWLLLAAFDTRATAALKLPARFSPDNFKAVILNASNTISFKNSAVISIVETVLVLALSLLAAYPLSRYNLKNGKRVSMFMLFLTSIPMTAIMVPVYQLFILMKLIDKMTGIIIFTAATALPYGIWMMKNFYDSISIELEEAAWTDGASSRQSITRIVMPLMIPGILTVAMFTFIGSWGNFFVPFILLNSSGKITASVNLYQFFGNYGEVVYGELAAYSVIYMLPIFVLYAFSQKYMSKGFSMGGATKG